ncbi:MAG: CRISPR-associated endonuclease Cas6 [Candidatus Zixiibacteriota bacterium]
MQIEKIRIKELKIFTKPSFRENGEGLRLAINSKWQDNPNLHGHDENGKSLFRLPPVRYIPYENPVLVATEAGFAELENIYDSIGEKLRVYSNEYKIIASEIKDREYDFGTDDELHSYRSISPWFALNSKCYDEYMRHGSFEKKSQLLQKVLVGNMLSLAKGLDIWVKEKLFVKIDSFDEVKLQLKGNPFLAFKANFTGNIILSDKLGIGKHVSLGFGRFAGND